MYEFKNQTHFSSDLNTAIKLAAESFEEYAKNMLGDENRLPEQFNLTQVTNSDAEGQGFKAEFCEDEGDWFDCDTFLSGEEAAKVFLERKFDHLDPLIDAVTEINVETSNRH